MPRNHTTTLRIELARLCPRRRPDAARDRDDAAPLPRNEFHVRRAAREKYGFDARLFASNGNVVFADFFSARLFAHRMNEKNVADARPDLVVKAGRVNAMGLIDEILHYVASLYRESVDKRCFAEAYDRFRAAAGDMASKKLLIAFASEFPPESVLSGKASAEAYVSGSTGGEEHAHLLMEELLLLAISNENPALEQFRELFDASGLPPDGYAKALEALESAFSGLPPFGPDSERLTEMLRAPMKASPYSLPGQLDYIRTRWGLVIGKFLPRLLGGTDMMREEDKPYFPGPGPTRAYVYDGMDREYERFSADADWMPNVVMIAKSTLVWLHQLSVAYGREVRTLDQIPDEELDLLASRGFNSLWLIGLWERSEASRRIKQICGNAEAAASAYSLFDYDIASELGGWGALENLRGRAAWRGIRLAADMVPNHTGIDSRWVRERPDLFVQRRYPPFPTYTFDGENLSGDGRVGVYVEDHYYSRSDAAVVFKRVDFATGDARYIYHGNDGTSMPWNDTAQIDFLRKEAREAVIERILHVARNFPVIRFDAAMTLAKRHFRRLWYPEPGTGGDIASRGEFSMSRADFDAAIPEEFWREVVDRCAREAPDTLLLAEAFWMMEGYFVRTLGMHRVYNSAFMNMLKREENAKYRETIRNTQEFDKDILKRFVNFMNNPDEETAEAQFGKGDKYFGVCTMMVTMPGLPMFGHGQVEGFTEKYGMEYRRAYRDESPDRALVERHEREIFPLMKRRYLFSGVDHFRLYDFWRDDGSVDENVFAYSNRSGDERALVLFNNRYERAAGWIRESSAYAEKLPDGGKRLVRQTLAEALGFSGREGGFTFMREQRSGLWYVRRSAEFASKGLFAMLDGFQTQVFLDLHERPDNEFGHYDALCDKLAGGGTFDVDAAVQDIFLSSLYEALSGLCSPEYFAAFEGGPEASKEWNKALASLEAPARRFLRAALDHVEAADAWPRFEFAESAEANGGETLPDEPKKRGKAKAADAKPRARAEAKPDATPPRIDETPAWEAFAAVFESSARCVAAARAGSGRLAALVAPGSLEAAALACRLAMRALAEVAALKTGSRERSAADARRLVDHWCLDRKLREFLQARGMDGESAWRAMSAAKASLAIVERIAALAADATLPEPLVAALCEGIDPDRETLSMVGANVYDGVLWIDKEKFERFADRVALAAACEVAAIAPKSPLTAQGKAKAAIKAIEAAEATAVEAAALAETTGYRWRAMLASFGLGGE
jgi:glycosidase